MYKSLFRIKNSNMTTNTTYSSHWLERKRVGSILAFLVAALSVVTLELGAQNCVGFNDVGGTVFIDSNTNGVPDSGELGAAGIQVRGYDAAGNVYGPAFTDASGGYTLSISNGLMVRLEFTNIPSSLALSPANSRTDVTVVQSPLCGVDLGLISLDGFCEDNPPIAVPCYVNGDPLLGGTSGSMDVLVGFEYESEGTTSMPDHYANGNELGAIWGLAFHQRSKKLFSAAFVKRHVGLGSLGTGGIYVTDLSGATPTNGSFIDLQNLGVSTGSVGLRDLSGDVASTSYDVNAFSQIGKIGLGDMDISADGNTLWVVNLAQKQLVSINIANYILSGVLPNASDVQTYNIPSPGCVGGEHRPFALKYRDGKVYVGVVCSAQTSGSRNNLSATVYEFTPSMGSFVSKVSFSLNYNKGQLTPYPFGDNCSYWEAWSDDYVDFYHRNLPEGICYPQPILSDIEFDVDGSMILGFMDRAGHQLGRDNLPPIPGTFELKSGTAGGDIIRVYDNGGTYQVENNGTAGPVAGCGVGSGYGIGGGEFYCDDRNVTNGEKETSMGSLTILPGSGQVVNTAVNPFVSHSGGIKWYDADGGQVVQQYQVYGDDPNFLGKAHGLGDLEVLCELPPISIGNYVWADINGNGVQDPNEFPISGVVLNLYTSTGTFLSSTVSNSNGHYIFNDANVPGGLNANTTYYISLSSTQYDPATGITVGTNTPGFSHLARFGSRCKPRP